MTEPKDEKLAAKGRRLVEAAKPQVDRLVQRAWPGMEKAARHAARYAAEHEDEIKLAVTKLLRARVRGPLRLALDAFARPSEERVAEAKQPLACAHCGASNLVSARFCGGCGAPLS